MHGSQQMLTRETMTNRPEALALLRRLLDDDQADFRDGQWEAIDALVSRRERVLLVQRTGWGKSAVYFVATRMLRDRGLGATLIVSPLLALMRNQVAAAQRMGVRAISINSTNRSEWPQLRRTALSDEADALLISPERLANEGFTEELLLPLAERIGLLVVDEAHCISDWGHDFRPDYRRLASVLRRMPANLPIVGTTATANDRVIDDVQRQLGQLNVHRGRLMRDSLHLQTLRLPTQAERLAWLAEHIDELPGTGITYTLGAGLSTDSTLRTLSIWPKRRFDGAFSIEGPILEGAVLLVDDVVDSNWTLTVVAALLRDAGCPTVWPFALATASTGD